MNRSKKEGQGATPRPSGLRKVEALGVTRFYKGRRHEDPASGSKMLWVTLAPPRGEESFHLDEERDLLPKLRHELGERPGGASDEVVLKPYPIALSYGLPRTSLPRSGGPNL